MTRPETYVPLSDRARAIILGSLLGDGSLKKQDRYANANLQIRHSDRQKEYFQWKVSELKEIAGPQAVNVQRPDGYSIHPKLRFKSRALPALSELHGRTHEKNTLRMRRAWLNTMTPLSLAVWWCDDGSLIGVGGRRGVFCTDGFDRQSVQMLSRYLKVAWGINTIVAPVGRKRDGKQEHYWRIWIRSQEELKKFLRIILPHIPVPSMIYKVLLLYKDAQLQQRWISEVVQLSRFPPAVILAEYEKKRARWTGYR